MKNSYTLADVLNGYKRILDIINKMTCTDIKHNHKHRNTSLVRRHITDKTNKDDEKYLTCFRILRQDGIVV